MQKYAYEMAMYYKKSLKSKNNEFSDNIIENEGGDNTRVESLNTKVADMPTNTWHDESSSVPIKDIFLNWCL